MTELIKKYFNLEEIETYITKREYNKETLEIVINFFENAIKDLESDNIMEEEDSKEYILKTVNKLVNHFESQRKLGYSYAWSLEYASKMSCDEKKHLLYYCYEASREVGMDQANKDLLLYCKLKNADKLFTDYLVKWIEEEGNGEPDAEEQATIFSATYKKQKEKGKSDVYAYQFADLSATQSYHPIYIEEYAYIYDKSISEGKDDKYAYVYAEKYASNVVDIKRRAGIGEDEEMIEYVKLEALAYIKAWDYARHNIEEDSPRFIKIFERVYLGLCYPDDDKDWVGFDKIDEIAISRTLEEFNK